MIYFALLNGSRIQALMQGDFSQHPGAVRIDSDLPPHVIMQEYAFQNGQMVHVGVAPTPYHSFDEASFSWKPEVDRLKSVRFMDVEAERVKRNAAPITYDGKRLDADGVAQKNLSDKLAGVRERIRLGVAAAPEMLIWKDADNIVHQWGGLQAYCDWLARYAIALEERGTRLYITSWQHKLRVQQLAEAGDFAGLLGYDVTSGWPAP